MDSRKIAAIVTIIVVTVAIVTVSAFVVFFNPTTTPATAPTSATGVTGASTSYPNGMMGGYGYGYTSPPVTVTTQPNTTLTTPTTTTNATSITMDDAVSIAQNYVAQLGNPNLAVKDVVQYSQNFCFQVYENNTGIGAFEMLINPFTGAVTSEPGPNTSWNTKYGPMTNGMMGYLTTTGTYPSDSGYYGMGGMMGGSISDGWLRGTPTANMPVSATQAKVDTQQWLNASMPGITAGGISPFYGYYTVMVVLNGNDYGMLGVNGYTGQVWYYTWLGTFIQGVDLS